MSTDTIQPDTVQPDAPEADAPVDAKREKAEAKAAAARLKAEAAAENARVKAEAAAENARLKAEEKAEAKARKAAEKAEKAANTSRASAETTPGLTPEQMEAFGDELDAIRRRVLDDLGEVDATYIRNVVKAQRGFEVAGRALFYLPPAWPLAVASLSISKILDNMEIGHNVMHGQYDWMGDPGLNSRMYEWDNVCPSEQWKNSHNYIHHTFTNILGKDRDIGYGILRMDEDQPWHPYYLGNPVYALALMLFFEWGVALHDLEVENIVAGKRKVSENAAMHAGIMRKVKHQALKDYLLFPALTGPLAPLTFAGNVTANLVRNVWAFNIIFCGHFPAGVATFTQEECEDETRGHWYYRQLLGSANISGGHLFHLLTGNLSHQIEHHLFPDLPARRYPEIAHEVRDICQRYGLPYNTGPLGKQLYSVAAKICRMALPDRKPAAATVEPETAEASTTTVTNAA